MRVFRTASSFTSRNIGFPRLFSKRKAIISLLLPLSRKPPTKVSRLTPNGQRSSCSVLLRGGGGQKLVALAQNEMVGHPGDVIADDAMTGFAFGEAGIVFGHPLRVCEKETEQLIKSAYRAAALLGDRGMGIDARTEKPFQNRVLLSNRRRECRESVFLAAHVFDGFDTACLHLPASVLDQVSRQVIQNALERFVEFQFS